MKLLPHSCIPLPTSRISIYIHASFSNQVIHASSRPHVEVSLDKALKSHCSAIIHVQQFFLKEVMTYCIHKNGQMQGHSNFDFWPPKSVHLQKSNQSKWTFFPILKKFLQGAPDISHSPEWDRQPFSWLKRCTDKHDLLVPPSGETLTRNVEQLIVFNIIR